MLHRLSRARSASEALAEDSGGPDGGDPTTEPDWDLPEELREFGGDPSDRKALLAFRQDQQAAVQVTILTHFCPLHAASDPCMQHLQPAPTQPEVKYVKRRRHRNRGERH